MYINSGQFLNGSQKAKRRVFVITANCVIAAQMNFSALKNMSPSFFRNLSDQRWFSEIRCVLVIIATHLPRVGSS